MMLKLMGGAAAVTMLSAASPAGAAEIRVFDIPAQPAAQAISTFARQAGLQVVAPAEGLEPLRTAPLRGAYETRAALRLLIAGTGLEIASDSNGIIVLRRAAPKAASSLEAGDVEPSMVEKIIVTAQKREEAAQDVPITLTAFSGRAAETYRLESLRDISRLTPGLLVSSFSYSSPTIAIRGATNTFTQIGANKPVAVVLDDLFIPRNSAATFDLYGLNSVQVLKGPQGTLFGRNVTGGAIILDTGKPSFSTPAAIVRAGVGDYDLRQLDGRVDLPLEEAAVLRLAGSLKSHSGYGRDRLTGREQDDLDSRSLRGQLRLRPHETLEVLLGADYSDDQNGGRTLSSKGAGADGDRRTSELGYVQDFARNQWGASARVYWSAPVGQVTSITGYRRSQSGEDYSGTGASYEFLTGTASQAVNRDVDQVGLLSQELRYASPKWEHGDFVAGAYLSDEDAKRQLRARSLAARTGAVSADVLTDQSVKTRSYAVFVDGVVHLPAEFDLTLGARYTHDEKIASLLRTDFIRPATGSFSARDLKASWSELTPRAVLSWSPQPDLRVYASVTRGYTAGGFNTDAATLAALTLPFAPETVTNYELGVKSQWLENRLQINAAVFHMDYEDKQELFFNNLTRVLTITNAAQATAKGGEIEIRYKPTSWLNLMANYGYLDTRYDNFVIPGGVVNTGNPLGSSPVNRGALAADVDLPLGSAGYLIGSASWAYTDGYYTGATKDPNLYVGAYALTNLTLGYEAPSRAWRISAWVKNLTDVEYLLTPSTQGVLAEYLGEPRTWGVMLSARF
ncbi:TonB-dependent receptor [Caulobacter sp. CCUG 60055]|uniref:TonB-dependent receptor domain-containing protein n=3 Tax=Bacteria TaxID=2 RepID=UPI001FA720E4|nr:TonB-dependent receptor [Caulobacter sp. CCUG 60055]MCI3179588.1 TonB-dependent receptor [Caulobacter sp. CCUG 60055]